MLTTAFPDLRLFWSAYDPLDLAGGSIDVLGFQSGYLTLANKFLPNLTTVTTSPRYVSMLCAGIVSAEKTFPGAGEPNAGLRSKRLEALKSYERAWAFACGLAAADGAIGKEAIDGLRGIQYIRRRINELAAREKSIRTGSINLLANQVRYGGIGAYSTLMEDCHLASMRSISARPLGAELAESFPGPDLPVWDENCPLSIEEIRKWGAKCHLAAFSRQEARCLSKALSGSDEGSWNDAVRWTSLRLLSNFATETAAESKILDELLKAVRSNKASRLGISEAVLRQIEATLLLITPYEQLSQAVHFLFDSVRAAATDEPGCRIESLASDQERLSAVQAAQGIASKLPSFVEQAGEVHAQTANDVNQALGESGILSLATSLTEAPDAIRVLELMLDRHRDVQQGKFAGGERKSSWIQRHRHDGIIRLSAQRFELKRSDRVGRWDRVAWHPYRTFGALRFIKACGIN